MFKIGDRVKFVDDTYATHGGTGPRKNGEKSEYYSRYVGKAGVVVSVEEPDPAQCMFVKFDDGTQVNCYTWRFTSEGPQWVLAPEGHEFKVGDRVKIGKLVDERANGFADSVGIAYGMRQYEGKEALVEDVTYKGRIYLDIDREEYFWNPRWLYYQANGVVAQRPKFQKGDEVVVAKNAIIKNGPKWIEEQDECLNEAGKITAIDAKNKDIYQVTTPSGEWWYCADALLSVKAFLKNGGKIKYNEAAIKQDLEEQIEAWLVKARKEAGSSCCDFATFSLKDGQVKTHSNIMAPCHAALHHYGDAPEIIGGVDFPYFGYARDNPAWDRYADYIINRSSFRIAFHPTNIEDVKVNGVRLNVEATADQVAGGCVALRHGTEWLDQLAMFAFLLDQGVDEDVAWLGSFMVRQTGDKDVFQAARVDGGHQVMSGGMPSEKIFSFFKNGWPDLKKKPYRESTNYAINAGMGYDAYRLGGVKKGSLNAFLKEKIKRKTVGDGWDAKTVITKDAVLEFCNAIHSEIQKA